MEAGVTVSVQGADASQDVEEQQRRMDAQRAQLHAFKTEQHELQLRLSKYAHDRKLLSEHNVELQEEITIMKEMLAQHQRDMDVQVQHVIELEGMLHENQIDAQKIHRLQEENEELTERLRQWERIHCQEKQNHAREQKIQQEELLTELEYLLAISRDELIQRQTTRISGVKGTGTNEEQIGQATRSKKLSVEVEPLIMRIKDLEAACKQKDQTICSLKGVVEQQETIFDEKMKIVTAKYHQVKAISLALQKRIISVATES
ncbi:hypothetical protein Plhal703r1_c23g0097231 [Plasmopara halstedii]